MQPYNPVKRTGTEKGSSVIYPPELIQEGLACSGIHVTNTYIPCNIPNPKNLIITPVLLSGLSENGIALFTTVVGWYVNSLETLSEAADVDDWAQAIAYNVGTVVLDPDDLKAYICIVAHTSTTGGTEAADWAVDLALDRWLELPSDTKFIKITHTSPGSAKVVNFAYAILGQN